MSKKVGIVYHPLMSLHKKPHGYHPECPERMIALYNSIQDLRWEPIPARVATYDEVTACHASKYYFEMKPDGMNPDMFYNSHTDKAALLAAGSVCELVTRAHAGDVQCGFAIVRPPGHHAHYGRAEGFCYLNNVLIAAYAALRKQQFRRVLIVDWDIHYHLGTEEILQRTRFPYTAEQLTVFSIHRHDYGKFYPGGQHGRTCTKHGGRVVNVGLNEPSGDHRYLDELRKFLDSYTEAGNPDLILVSCGFDAARGDPLGQYDVTPRGYAEMTGLLLEKCPNVIMALEGGYDLKAISTCGRAVIQALIR